MAKTTGYDQYAQEYDQWFDQHSAAFESELAAIKHLLPAGKGLDVGAGGGRFTLPLNIKYGVEPSAAMRDVAQTRGLTFHDGIAEALPFADAQFDFVLFVTSVCFVDDVLQAFKEAKRVLRSEGEIVIGFIDKHSPLGQSYQQHKQDSPFYRDATFLSTDELIEPLKQAGFSDFKTCQTLFADLPIDQVQPVRPGHDQGAFVVIKAQIATDKNE